MKYNPDFVKCLIDGNQGIHIPQIFAVAMRVTHSREQINGFTSNYAKLLPEFEICESGPDHAEYWEAWQNILEVYEWADEVSGVKFCLWQDGDLFAIPVGMEVGEEG